MEMDGIGSQADKKLVGGICLRLPLFMTDRLKF